MENLELAKNNYFVRIVDSFNPRVIRISRSAMKTLLAFENSNTNPGGTVEFLGSMPDGSELKNLYSEILTGDPNLIVIEDSGMNHMMDIMFHTGAKPDELTRFMLSVPEESLSYEDLWYQALKISAGDPLESIGIIVLNLSFDAASNRNRTAILNSKVKKVVFPSKQELGEKNNFNFQPGFNYHFWASLAEGWFHNNTFLRTRSYFFENIIQDDPSKGEADQLGYSLAIKTLSSLTEGLPSGCVQN